jgi:tRNA nucleotidyltransferase/poly(A) polymerase
MLRAVRFAATFKFTIDPDTLLAVQEMAPQINTVSAERIGAEIRRMLLDPNRKDALFLLRETNLLLHVLPEIASLKHETFDDTSRVLAILNSPSLSLALAALLMPCSPDLVAPLGRRLRYTNKEVERTAWLLVGQPLIAQAPQLPWPKLQRLLTHDGASELVSLREAIAGPSDPALAYCHERLAWPQERLNPRPLIDGSTLIHHGLTPGPQFSDLLEQVRDAQLDGEIKTQQEALAMVDRLRASDKPLP